MIKAKMNVLFAALWMLCISTFAQAATLELVNSSPADSATNVSRTDALSLQFSDALYPASVRADNVTLQNAMGPVYVKVSVSGATILVQPAIPLLPWTNYTLNVTSISGGGGLQLASPIRINFKTRDASWQTFPKTVDRLTPQQWNPVTATNAKGVRFVAWLQTNDSGTGDDIWAIRHIPGATSSAVRVATFPQDTVSELSVFVDEDGNAFTTWVIPKDPVFDPPPVRYPPTWHLWAVRFTTGSGTGSGWGTPQIIDGYSIHSATNLHVVFDHVGNAFALCQEFDCCGLHSQQSIVAARYTGSGGWGHPVYLDGAGSFDSFFIGGKIDIQLDNAGDAYATWATLEDLNYPVSRLFVAYYKATTGGFVWSPRQLIATEPMYATSASPTLAVNPRGDAIIMWADESGLQYAHTDESGRWSAPILIDSSVALPPSQVVMLDNGQAFAAFANGVKIFMPGNGWWSWTHPLLVSQNASSDPRIVVDLNGNALVAWTQTVSGVNRIYTKRYLVNRGWFGAMSIDSQFTLGGNLQELFIEPSGSVVAAWLENNNAGTLDVVTDRFE